MIQKKIHRLVRLFNKFTFDDIAITLELGKEDEKKARKHLSGLVKEGIVKKISADWYRDYQDRSFVHDSEFEESRIHSQSYDHRIGHIRGKNDLFSSLIKSVKCMEEFFHRPLFSSNKLNIID